MAVLRSPIATRSPTVSLDCQKDCPSAVDWFYLIPAQGAPRKLVHRVEAEHLDSLTGTKQTYSGWRELSDQLRKMLTPFQRLAMQYSPDNLIFMVDAGTVEMVRGFGHDGSAEVTGRIQSELVII